MDKDLFDYYTTVEREIFQLIDFYENCIKDRIEAKKLHVNDIEMIVAFDIITKNINKRTSGRKLLLDKLEKRNDELRYERTHVFCPECFILRKVEIVSEAKHPDSGLMCDNVICTACGTKFMNRMPNNSDDQTKQIELDLKEMKKWFKSEVNQKLFPDDYNELPSLIEQCKYLKKSERKHKENMEKLRLITIEGDTRMEKLRDELQANKVSNSYSIDFGKYLS